MTKLAAWSIDRQPAGDASQQLEPRSLGRSHLGLEKQLEDWIAKDATLIAEGLTLVGRQVSIDDGRLDLLGIDSQDRWVVIEIKPGMLHSNALAQALYYASSIVRLGADELYAKLEHGLDALGDAKTLSARLKQQLDGEAEEREIAVMLVGAGIHPGLERMSEFLGRFGVPVGVVSFEVFELDGGPQLLVREVVDEPAEPPPPRRKLTVEAIRRRAVDVGVGEQFDRFVAMAKKAGLAVQPQPVSVRIAPPANRTRFLMYARPDFGDGGGRLHIGVGPKEFVEFFPDLDEREIVEALALAGSDWESVGGKELDATLDRIERFLMEKFPQTDGGG